MRKLIKATGLTAITGLAAFAILTVPYNTAYAWSEEVEINVEIESAISIGGGTETDDVELDGTPNSSGEGEDTSSNTIVVDTNDENGYTLRLSMVGADRNLNLGGSPSVDNITGTATGTFAALADNTWGYNTNASANFAGVPALASPVALNSSTGPVQGHSTTVTYGIKTTTALPAGTYSNTVQYTAVANP